LLNASNLIIQRTFNLTCCGLGKQLKKIQYVSTSGILARMRFLMSSTTRLAVGRLEGIPKHQYCLYQSSIHQNQGLKRVVGSKVRINRGQHFLVGVRAKNLAKPKFHKKSTFTVPIKECRILESRE